MKRAELDYLIQKLRPYSKGCFSGNIIDWPDLKPLLKRTYETLKDIREDLIENKKKKGGKNGK